jgi:hypothetical protein
MFAIIHLLATFIADLFKPPRRLEVENLSRSVSVHGNATQLEIMSGMGILANHGVAFTGTARAFGSAPVAQLPLAGLSASQR